jgi:hypothetical protein
MHDRQPLFCVACLTECICDRLRACEQRLWQQPLLAVSRRAGWNDALIAAREAVAALDIGRDVRFSVDVRADALAAIDALRLPAEP